MLICAPIAKGQKGTNKNLFEKLGQDGFLRVKIDDKIIEKVEIINTEPIEKKSWRDYFEYLLEKLTEVSCLKW